MQYWWRSYPRSWTDGCLQDWIACKRIWLPKSVPFRLSVLNDRFSRSYGGRQWTGILKYIYFFDCQRGIVTALVCVSVLVHFFVFLGLMRTVTNRVCPEGQDLSKIVWWWFLYLTKWLCVYQFSIKSSRKKVKRICPNEGILGWFSNGLVFLTSLRQDLLHPTKKRAFLLFSGSMREYSAPFPKWRFKCDSGKERINESGLIISPRPSVHPLARMPDLLTGRCGVPVTCCCLRPCVTCMNPAYLPGQPVVYIRESVSCGFYRRTFVPSWNGDWNVVWLPGSHGTGGQLHPKRLLKNVSPGEFSISRPPRLRGRVANFGKKVNKKVKKSSPVDKCKTLWISSAFCVGVWFIYMGKWVWPYLPFISFLTKLWV